jgi:hypothetical protein
MSLFNLTRTDVILFNFNEIDSKNVKSEICVETTLFVKDEFEVVCVSFLALTFNVVAIAGNIKKHNVKYKKLKPIKTQNNWEKNEKVSNWGIY